MSDVSDVQTFEAPESCLLVWVFSYFSSSHFPHRLCSRDFAKTIKRPFSVYYNPYTQSIDLLKDTRSIENVVQDLRSDLTTVCDALGKMNTYMGI